MVVAPTVKPEARPVEFICATLVLDELQATTFVKFNDWPVVVVPVAANCSLAPNPIDGFAGDTASDVRPVVTPVPLRLTVCGELLASLLKVSVPARRPSPSGWKTMLNVQSVRAGTLVPHELLCTT